MAEAKAVLFLDGSIESQKLEHELSTSEFKVQKVNVTDRHDLLTNVSKLNLSGDDVIVIQLPNPSHDYDDDFNNQINQVKSAYPGKIEIVRAHEFEDGHSIRQKAVSFKLITPQEAHQIALDEKAAVANKALAVEQKTLKEMQTIARLAPDKKTKKEATKAVEAIKADVEEKKEKAKIK